MTADPISGVHLYRPRTFYRKRYLRCPTCECTTECVVAFYEWHDPWAGCCRCGESWSHEGIAERPWYRYWRRDRVRVHRKLWDEATFGPPPSLRDFRGEAVLVTEAVLPS